MRSTLARKNSSQSETRRSPNSSLASECRLMDQPCNCSLHAIVSCDQPRSSRHLRTWMPTKFRSILCFFFFFNMKQNNGFQRRRLFPT